MCDFGKRDDSPMGKTRRGKECRLVSVGFKRVERSNFGDTNNEVRGAGRTEYERWQRSADITPTGCFLSFWRECDFHKFSKEWPETWSIGGK